MTTLKDQIDEAARKYASDYFTDRTSTDHHDDVRAYTAGAAWAYEKAVRDVTAFMLSHKAQIFQQFGPKNEEWAALIKKEFGLSEGEK